MAFSDCGASEIFKREQKLILDTRLRASLTSYFDDPDLTVIPDSYKIDEKELRVIAYLRNIIMHTSGLNDAGEREFYRLLPLLLEKALSIFNDDEVAHDSPLDS